jgi:hypothetical protein
MPTLTLGWHPIMHFALALTIEPAVRRTLVGDNEREVPRCRP